MSTPAVNKPVDIKTKDADVNNKLQLYGIYTALSQGKVPSNKQIDIALNSVIDSNALASPSGKLSPEGRKLVGDLRAVIQKAKLLVLMKNDGNLLQDFIWQTQQFHTGGAKAPGAPVGRETAKQEGEEALEGLRMLGTLLISNGQFRKLLNDAAFLLRSMAGDAASNAATRVNPSQDQLDQIDQPAEDNTWREVPNVSRSSIQDQVRAAYQENKPFGKEEANQAASNAAHAATGTRDPAQGTQIAQQQGAVDAPSGATAATHTLQGAVDQNVPDETKENTKETKKKWQESSRNYLSGKMPKERREQTIWRLKKMVVEIQGHQDYQRAIETLLRLAENYKGHARSMTKEGTSTAKGVHSNDSLSMAEADLKTLIERFANSTSFDDLFDAINQIYRDADNDKQLRGWFQGMDHFVRRCLQEQGFIMQDEANEEWDRLYDHGNYLLRDKYRSHTDRVLDEIKFFSTQFEEDPQNKAFGDSVHKLFSDLANDENGKHALKPHLLKDLTEVIIPGFLENVRYVPIPRIEFSDSQVDVVVENLIIESDNLAPNVVEFTSDNYFRWGRKKIASRNKNQVTLHVSGVQMDLRDVSFYVKRKQGFPSITDTGVADIFLPGDGLSFKIDMETADDLRGRHKFFKVNRVRVDINGFDVKLKRSNHKLLFALVKPLLFKVMRPALTKIIEKQIKDSANQLDGFLYDIHTEAKRAEADYKRNPDPEQARNIYQRYADAANKRFMQGKRKAERAKAATEDKKVNMAVTQQESIFPNIKLPGGISTKATEYKELAGRGEKWESPVFSIGSARETTGVPKISNIRRKGGAAKVQRDRGGQGATGHLGQTAESYRTDANQAFQTNPSAQPQGTGPHGDLVHGNLVQEAMPKEGLAQETLPQGIVPQGSVPHPQASHLP
ncbi:hypothetical protein P152DRAFT_188737 [Eremomyces bilateralis CBS 781.70]|uniref:Uncharacterized protein n=1 Tax=Eremomyces bilateralis CBS 781.70 TaxID=1392243 RepID=A0A6G1GBZ2_9PEZI|nr:uncharacterized protein P152DRAFT_188737 [Eremomyces bilateralis CBS 781.70]KAF1815544.1 hypothetical protein P152DRAFT_188737 [Eremomyces bilateralis CBS 781.70]